jgi:exopolyphosphatase/guanosine-5'-triphosphate,3'-diphosphate pyrophosphatase
VLVVDIGGGSTEFMIGDTELRGVMSIDVGAGRVTERELHGDPPRPEELTNAIGLVWDHVDDVLRELPAVAEAGTIVGLGGTVKVAASVELGLPRFDAAAVHGFEFSRAAVEDVFRTLATEPLADRLHNPGLPADRAEVIVGGCCVLVAILRRLGAPGLVVSSHGLLDAVAHELLESTR